MFDHDQDDGIAELFARGARDVQVPEPDAIPMPPSSYLDNISPMMGAGPGTSQSCVVAPMMSSFMGFAPSMQYAFAQPSSSATIADGEDCHDGGGSGPNAYCWGAQLPGGLASCSASFLGGKRHFKNKFCPSCRQGLAVPAIHVRALTTALHEELQNRPSEGFWNEMRTPFAGSVRVVNNTAGCSGPWLAIYKHSQPPELEWAEMPPAWIDEDGMINLIVAKGTLVPTSELSSWRAPKASALPDAGRRSPPEAEPSPKRPRSSRGAGRAHRSPPRPARC